MKENIILIGFMGVGKTSLGKLLASKLGTAGRMQINSVAKCTTKFSLTKIKKFSAKRIAQAELKAV